MSNETQTKAETGEATDDSVAVSGILDILQTKTGQPLDPARNGKTRPGDPFVPREMIKAEVERRVSAAWAVCERFGVSIGFHSGSGKSALALELLALGARLVADDGTLLRRDAARPRLWAAAGEGLPARIEARGVGLIPARLVGPVPLYATLVKLDDTLHEASADLGARPWATFLHVTLPLSLPGILSGGILVFVLTISALVPPRLTDFHGRGTR